MKVFLAKVDMAQNDERPSFTVGGKVIFISSYTGKNDGRICKIDDGNREYACEISGPIFIEQDDVIALTTSNTRIGKQGVYKGKTIYQISDPSAIVIQMSDDDETVRRCLLKADSRTGKGAKAFNEFSNLASAEDMTIAEYLYQVCEDGAYADPVLAWWLKHRVYRRLWNLGFKRKNIEECVEALQCRVAELYDLLTVEPGPLRLPCINLGMAISLSKQFRISYSKQDKELARIARFIYQLSAADKHTCIGQTVLREQFANFNERVDELVAKYNIVKEGKYYYLKYNHEVVFGLVSRLAAMITTKAPTVNVAFLENDHIDERQRKAVVGALNHRLFGIFGGPGSGKTTIIKYIVRNLESRGVSYMLAAPTGAAVVRIQAAIQSIVGTANKSKCMTLDMLVKKKGLMPIEHLIVDEISMANHSHLYRVLMAYPGIRYLTVVGDDGQLQPLKWGYFMEQLLESKVVPFVKLKRVYRSEHDIIQLDEDDDLISHEYCELKGGGIDSVISSYRELLSQGIRPRDIIIITPTNAAVDELNSGIQELIAQREANGEYLKDGSGRKFIVGDKVILLKNNYEIDQMNGDIGQITYIDLRRKALTVEFATKSEEYFLSTNSNKGDYTFHGDSDIMTTDSLALAHAITIHKSQGSEWPYVKVYVPEGKKNVDFFNCNMIKTALTRTMMRASVHGSIRDIRKYYKLKPEKRLDLLGKLLARRVEELQEDDSERTEE